MLLLGKPRISGTFPVTASEQGTILARIPINACEPGMLCIRNLDTAATLYIKTVEMETGQVRSSDAGIVLYAREAYEFPSFPRGCYVIAISSVNNALAAVEGNWAEVPIGDVPL